MPLLFLLFCVFFSLIGGWLGVAQAEPAFYSASTVINAKNLELEGGQKVRLASLQAPNPDEPQAEEARQALEKLVLGQKLELRNVGKPDSSGRTLDRKGRWVAQLYREDGLWVQETMIRQGWGVVYIFPDSCEIGQQKKSLRGKPCTEIEALLAAETQARNAGRGIWAEPYFAVTDADQAQQKLGRFTLVEGVVQEVAIKKDKAYINFGADWKTDFTVMVEKPALKYFDLETLSLLAGRKIRVRGWVNEKNGPMMEIEHPLQIERLLP